MLRRSWRACAPRSRMCCARSRPRFPPYERVTPERWQHKLADIRWILGRPMQNDRTLAMRLAEKICAFDITQATPRALAQSRTATVDTIGVTLAGMVEDCTRILLRTPGVAAAPGASLIFGSNRRTSALDATLINGTASHALD